MSAVETRQRKSVRFLPRQIGVTLSFLALVCGLAVAVMQPVAAYASAEEDLTSQSIMTGQAVEISGTVNASTLQADASYGLKLAGNTTLNLDADITCAHIESRDCDLTITGSKTLTIYNTSSYGIEMRDGDLTIAGGTVFITTPQDCILSQGVNNGDINITGGTVSIVATKDSIYGADSTMGARAITTYFGINIDNASVYCEGEIYASGTFGAVTIGKNAKMTVSTAAKYASGVIYTMIGNMKEGGSFSYSGPFVINGTITKPAGGKVGEVQTVDGFDPDTGAITQYSGLYNRTIVANGKAANEVVINGGAVKPTEKTSISGAKVTGLSTQTYKGRAIEQVPTVMLGNSELKANVDFTYKATNNTNVGTATVTVEGIGDYTGTASGTFEITPLAKAPTVKLSATSYMWDGKAKKPTVSVDMGNALLIKSSDYAVTYATGRKNVGSYTVTVSARKGGNYSFADKKLSFTINPKGTTVKAPKVGAKALTVKWAKQAKKMSASTVTGYQVQVATNKAFTKNKKQVNVKGFKKTSVKVSKLKAKKAYYVRVRTYMKAGKATCYSAWSTYKKAVKTK